MPKERTWTSLRAYFAVDKWKEAEGMIVKDVAQQEEMYFGKQRYDIQFVGLQAMSLAEKEQQQALPYCGTY